MCASPVLIGLGIVPAPGQEQPEIDLTMARHYIDLLALLDEKTADQLDEDEQTELDEALHELRMAFVQMQQAVQDPPAEPDQDDARPHDEHAAAEDESAAAPARDASDANEPGPDPHDASEPIEDSAEDD